MDHSTIISSKTVFESELFTVQASTLRYPNGEEGMHHDVYRQPTVSVLPLTDKYELYLVKEYRYLLGRTALEVVAGFVEKNEAPLHGAKRELHEETGIEAAQWEHVRSINLAASVIKTQAHIFLAKGLTRGIARPEADEEIEVIKMPLQQAVEKVMLGEITTATSIIGILLLDKLRKEKKL